MGSGPNPSAEWPSVGPRIEYRSDEMRNHLMRMWLRSISVGLLLTTAVLARAESPCFLSKTAIDPARLLPPPPSPESQETKAELELLLRVQQQRTPADIARVKAEAKLTMATIRATSLPAACSAWRQPGPRWPIRPSAPSLPKSERNSMQRERNVRDRRNRMRIESTVECHGRQNCSKQNSLASA